MGTWRVRSVGGDESVAFYKCAFASVEIAAMKMNHPGGGIKRRRPFCGVLVRLTLIGLGPLLFTLLFMPVPMLVRSKPRMAGDV